MDVYLTAVDQVLPAPWCLTESLACRLLTEASVLLCTLYYTSHVGEPLSHPELPSSNVGPMEEGGRPRHLDAMWHVACIL